jgi:uncharacterized protein YerC
MTATMTDTRRQQAEGRLLVIRNALEVADQELGRALAERDWEVYDLASFEEYCAEKLPDLVHIKLRAPERRARVKKLLEAGATRRQLAAATGASLGQVQKDVVALRGPQERSLVNATPSLTGESRADQVVRLVGLAGDEGMTVRELCARARIHHGAASGALSRVHRQGRVRRLLRYRDDCAVYVLQP